MIEVVVTTRAMSNRHHQQTNTHNITGQMPFVALNNSVRALKEKSRHSSEPSERRS